MFRNRMGFFPFFFFFLARLELFRPENRLENRLENFRSEFSRLAQALTSHGPTQF